MLQSNSLEEQKTTPDPHKHGTELTSENYLEEIEQRAREFAAMVEEHCPRGGFLFGDLCND